MADQQEYIQDDEITLKELILKIKEFWRELWKYWWLIAIITLPFLGYMVYKAVNAEVTYPAQLTFMVNKDEGGGLSGLSGILGTFGLGGGGKGEYNLDKMLQLLKSRRITEHVLFTAEAIEGNSDFLANHVINNLDTLDKWSSKPGILGGKPDPLKDFRFTHDSIEIFSNLENAAVKRLQGRIIGSENNAGFLSSGYNEESGILNIKCETQHEYLSIVLTNNYFEKLSKFYTDKTIGGQKITYDLIKIKSDSIFSELSTSEYQLAKLIETSRGIYLETEQLKKQRLNREIQKLSLMYAETAKNLEIADFTLKTKTPFVTLIDAPISPIKPNSTSLLRSLIVGGFLGVFVGALFVVARKIYKDTMA
ncbi:hypothetical protein [Portibacter lacus]|uniref:Polysaccharide chain length determinant N-terminal domain-containing protein n=1 Tax=Portibacter lacus TaxID=1099794 RepID=A0AA37SRS7_9BACT|nr:hypothetical protein [Portibacter lacus]GLR18832.1 hypothetical protein GCM10007940_34480 [Portibacter lacus]